MPEFDVVVWQDAIADGSIRYSAWCTAVAGAWGYGDTIAEALDHIGAAMTSIVNEPWDDGVSVIDPAIAAAKMADLRRELDSESVPYWMHRVSVYVDYPQVRHSGASRNLTV